MLGTTYGELCRERTPWHERCLDVGRGKRVSYGDGRTRSVLMTFIERASFDILWDLDQDKRWDPLTTGRARGLLREIFSAGRAKFVELQRAVERLGDLMRRYTQRRDARNGKRHTLAEDIRMAALETLLPENSSDTANSSGHGWTRIKPKERRRTPLARGKGLQDNRTRKRIKVSVGIAGKQVINRRVLGKSKAATEPRTIKFFWKGKRRERQVWQRWKERQIQKCWSTCLESAD